EPAGKGEVLHVAERALELGRDFDRLGLFLGVDPCRRGLSEDAVHSASSMMTGFCSGTLTAIGASSWTAPLAIVVCALMAPSAMFTLGAVRWVSAFTAPSAMVVRASIAPFSILVRASMVVFM